MSKELTTAPPIFADLVKVDGKMFPKPSMRNALIALDALDVKCTYDTFADRRYIAGELLGSQVGQITDDVCLLVRRICRDRFAFDPGKDALWDAVNLKCRLNSYHPIRDYLEAVEFDWDGVNRIDTWLTVYLGVPETPLVKAMSRLILIASVRRVRSPGCKWDYMPVLVGPENMAKSLSISTLYGHEYFSDQKLIGISDKELAEAVRGRWANESAELAGLRKADIDHLKAQITRQTDRIRPAYGRAVIDVPRQNVMWGTTNDPIFLRSQHGNRRLVPLEPTMICIAALKADRDQLWAEASLAEREHGASLAMPADVWEEAKAKQAEHVEFDPWADKLADITEWAEQCAMTTKHANATRFATNPFAEPDAIPYERRDGLEHATHDERVSSAWLLGVALGIPEERQSPAITHRLSTVMQQLGWSNPHVLKIGGGTAQRGYKRELQ